MFYDENQAIKACEEEPSLVFELIKEEYMEVVDKVLSKKNFDINITDADNNDVLSKLLKTKHYDLVLKYMKNKNWDINHQNNDGDAFAHLLVTINYVYVKEIISELRKNKEFIPNIKNNKGETILDKSINNNYIYTTVKILEDERFDNIDIVSFKNLYNTYIKSHNYGKYSRLNNLEVIISSLEEKKLLPRMQRLVELIKDNMDKIKEDLVRDNLKSLDQMINNLIRENV